MTDERKESDTKLPLNDSAMPQLQAQMVAFRQVGAPLLQAMAEAPAGQGGDGASKFDADQFSSLVDSTVALNEALADALGGADKEALTPDVRWSLVGAASHVIAARYKSAGRAPSEEEIGDLASIAATLQEKFKTQIPAGGESLPNTVATFRAMMMEALVPVIGAIAQYAFGRSEHELLADVAERLVKTADQVTRALAAPDATPEQWRLLCWNVLRAAGQIYTECHYAEADRLLYMSADDRAAYFAQHGNTVPMVQVWQAFNQRMAMLATLATYLDVPETAGLDKQGWP